MSDPYAAPGSGVLAAGPAEAPPDGLLTAARFTLGFVGLCYVGIGFGMGPFVLAMDSGSSDPMPLGLKIAFVLVGLLVGLVVAAFNFLAAWGLGRTRRWAWLLALVLGAIYLPSACLPFGAVIVAALVRDPVRKAYLG